MRKKIVAGNWKMNKTMVEAKELVATTISHLPSLNNSQVIFCPPALYLSSVAELIKNHATILVAAQNCSEHEKGAYTGEISAEMIASVGANAVIIGHSERRLYFNETNVQLLNKTKQALKHQLKVIFCIGESLQQRNENVHFDIIKSQLTETVFNLSKTEFEHIIIAYEPVWAIGTGLTASSAQAQEMHQFIRNLISTHFDENTADNTSILYGGSCNAKNANELFACKDVDGGLIGGASLVAEDFIKIIEAL